MVTMNSFDLLGDVDMEDPSQLVELLQQKINSKKSAAPVVAHDVEVSAANFPSKPLPPSQAVQERRAGYSWPRDGGRGGAGRGRGGRGSGFVGRNSYTNENYNGYTPNDSELEKDSRNVFVREHGMLSRPGSHKPIRDGRNQSGDYFSVGDRSSRIQNRWGPVQKQLTGKGNWTSPHDQPEEKREDLVAEVQEIVSDEKVVEQSDAPASEANKEIDESKTNEEKEAEAKKAQEDKEMTLEEYEKVLEEKRKALVAMKAEERKVELDKGFESMKLLSLKKGKDEIFAKLGSDKDSGKRKDGPDREEKVKKSVSITEFLKVKPAEGERRNYRSGGGRDRGHGGRGAPRGGDGAHNNNYARSAPAAPSIADVGHFPSLGGK